MRLEIEKEALTKELIADSEKEGVSSTKKRIAVIDEDGFVTIKDRLSRFSKIGGEMVPHIKIEEEIQNILGCLEPA